METRQARIDIGSCTMSVFLGEKRVFSSCKKRGKKEEKGGRLRYIPGFYVAAKIEPKGRCSSTKSNQKS
jgi:hypothetical protein